MDVHVRDNFDYIKAVLDGTVSQTVKFLGTFRHESANVVHTLKETDGAADEKVWQWVTNGGQHYLQGVNDLENSGGGSVFLIDRAGVEMNYFSFGNQSTPPFKVTSAGVVTVGDGAVGAPGLAFASDTDTGLYRVSANTLDVALGGAQAVSMSSVGVLAAGTSTSAGGFAFINDPDTGMFRGAANALSFLMGGANLLALESSSTRYGQTTAWMHMTGAVAAVLGSAVPLVVDRQTNDGVLISLRQDSTEEGSISVSSTTVSYNTFMASHDTQLTDGQEEPPIGGVVVTTGALVQSESVHYIEDVIEAEPEPKDERARGVTVRQVRHETRDNSAWREVRGETKDYLPHVAGTTIEGDPAVYGIWFGMRRPDAAGGSFGKNGRPVYSVAGVGAYECRVTDTGGDIGPGDLLCASARMYEAMRQADDVIRAGTLGKALSRVAWADVPVDRALGYKWALVSVALYCG